MIIIILLCFSGDYREMEGEKIPYRSIGYSTLEEFLDQGRDFCRISYGRDGNLVLRGIPNESNAHIAHMVSKQRSVSKKKPAKAPMRRPAARAGGRWMPPNVRMGGGGGGEGRPSQYGQPRRYGDQLAHSRGRAGQSRPVQFRHATANSQQPRPANVQVNGWGAGGGYGQSQHQQQQQQQQGRRITSQTGGQQRVQQQQQQQQQPSPAVVDPKNKRELEEFCQSYRLDPPEFKTAPFNKKFVSVVIVGTHRFQTFPTEYNTAEAAEAAAAKLAMDGLRKVVTGPAKTGGPSGDDVAVTGKHQAETASKAPPSQVAHASTKSAPPSSSSVADSPGGTDAELRTIEERVLRLVGDRTNGVWSTQIDVEYRRKHGGQQLPANWARMLMEAGGARLSVNSPIEGRYIVAPAPKKVELSPAGDGDSAGHAPSASGKTIPAMPRQHQEEKQPPSLKAPQRGQSSVVSNGFSGSAGQATPTGQKRPPALNLPSDEDFWNVYITSVHST